MSVDVGQLRKIIRDLHGVEATHLRSEDVREMFQGKVAWEHTVQVFEVRGDARARLAYAWAFQNDKGNREYVAVLGVPPVNSPLDAVRASIAAEMKRGMGEE